MRRPVVVVVGAGSAGSVVAGTLAAADVCSVVLLEAGPDRIPGSRPASVSGPSFVAAMTEPGFTWDPLPAVRVTGQDPRRYVRGRGLGGSSAVNAMVALTGHPDDYDEWERDLGCAGWGWSSFGPWFDRVRATHPFTEAHPSEVGALGRAMGRADVRTERALLTRNAAGARVTASDVFVEPWRESGRLGVRGGCEVRRVLFDGRRAVGVELVDGSVIDADAVIVCAGAIHSPTVLLRSGVDLPGVGVGLQDHPSFPLTLVVHDGVRTEREMLSVGALLRSAHREPDDLQVLAMDEVGPEAPGVGVLLGAVMRVWSRGAVRLGAEPMGPPEVDFTMLSDERDMEAMRAVVDLVERVAASPAVSAVADVVPHSTDDDAVRSAVGDYVHAACTCRMGPVGDERSVVDTEARVIGCDGLWVIDASVMPRLPRANTHLPTMALALRLATQWVERTTRG